MKIFPISMFFMMLSLNISASEIYQCKSPEGKVKYSEKPCVKGESQDRRDFKDIPWTTKLDANKPAGTKIIEITEEDKKNIDLIKIKIEKNKMTPPFIVKTVEALGDLKSHFMAVALDIDGIEIIEKHEIFKY